VPPNTHTGKIIVYEKKAHLQNAKWWKHLLPYLRKRKCSIEILKARKIILPLENLYTCCKSGKKIELLPTKCLSND